VTKKRRISRTVKVGNVCIGGKHPVSIQSMTNTDTRDVNSTILQISELEKAGCEIVRIAIPDQNAANSIKQIVQNSCIPVIADIHFDHNLAIAAIAAGINGIRINPGNIGSKDNVKAVAEAAGEAGIPIRIGANSGSLSHNFQIRKNNNPLIAKENKLADALANSALEQCDLLENYAFKDIKVSLKASDVLTTVAAYRKFAKITNYPLHLGVTEAGTPFHSTVKSSIGIGSLLLDGIGDTIRVSVTGDPVEEIKIAKAILESTGHLLPCPEIISCPTCGRTEVDLLGIVAKVEKEIKSIKQRGLKFKPSKIAVMGCAVNGPGEAKDADIGIAGAGKGHFIIFRNSKTVGAFKETEAFNRFRIEIKRLIKTKQI
jgi:(E)-4-hydroxy-3-methylbut-2-enyl-diphosphate synthase